MKTAGTKKRICDVKIEAPSIKEEPVVYDWSLHGVSFNDCDSLMTDVEVPSSPSSQQSSCFADDQLDESDFLLFTTYPSDGLSSSSAKFDSLGSHPRVRTSFSELFPGLISANASGRSTALSMSDHRVSSLDMSGGLVVLGSGVTLYPPPSSLTDLMDVNSSSDDDGLFEGEFFQPFPSDWVVQAIGPRTLKDNSPV